MPLPIREGGTLQSRLIHLPGQKIFCCDVHFPYSTVHHLRPWLFPLSSAAFLLPSWQPPLGSWALGRQLVSRCGFQRHVGAVACWITRMRSLLWQIPVALRYLKYYTKTVSKCCLYLFGVWKKIGHLCACWVSPETCYRSLVPRLAVLHLRSKKCEIYPVKKQTAGSCNLWLSKLPRRGMICADNLRLFC